MNLVISGVTPDAHHDRWHAYVIDKDQAEGPDRLFAYVYGKDREEASRRASAMIALFQDHPFVLNLIVHNKLD
jgi:hypothetical protein